MQGVQGVKGMSFLERAITWPFQSGLPCIPEALFYLLQLASSSEPPGSKSQGGLGGISGHPKGVLSVGKRQGTCFQCPLVFEWHLLGTESEGTQVSKLCSQLPSRTSWCH